MIAMAARRGIGSVSSGYGQLSPEFLLDSPDTAVVVVEGVIPPAATEDSHFDIRIFAYPTSATTSLEGGRLYTTELVPVMRPNVGRRMLPPSGGPHPAAHFKAVHPRKHDIEDHEIRFQRQRRLESGYPVGSAGDAIALELEIHPQPLTEPFLVLDDK